MFVNRLVAAAELVDEDDEADDDDDEDEDEFGDDEVDDEDFECKFLSKLLYCCRPSKLPPVGCTILQAFPFVE